MNGQKTTTTNKQASANTKTKTTRESQRPSANGIDRLSRQHCRETVTGTLAKMMYSLGKYLTTTGVATAA